ncbi:ammonium transporter [Salinibacter ruber]|uniref:ammonium transporter n=1 Tax=Salinibacter ruber TaxID=146919 RepID=UPI003C6E35BE
MASVLLPPQKILAFGMRIRTFVLAVVGLLFVPIGAAAMPLSDPANVAEALQSAEQTQTNLDYVWTILAAALVFFMQAGFALLESGFSRAKNAVNIIMKNVMDASAGALVFFAVGFGLMFGTSWGGLIGTDGFFLTGTGDQPQTWVYAFYFFQAVFAATAATIVSGAVAERIKFSGYLIFSVTITGLIYPVFGAWAWGGLFNGSGWLEALGFIDFAGSTVVHSVGGWAALAGALVVGPRVGKYADDGTPRSIPGHSLPLAALGVFILWLGWFGFNAGSTTAGSTAIAKIAMNTFVAAGAGAVAAMAITWIDGGTPDATMTLNGVLGGLVGITAGCAALTPPYAILTGAIAGAVVVYGTRALEWYVDDPVGAIAVHGLAGAWGTIAAGLFNSAGFSLSQVGVQVVGVAAAFLWTFPVSYLVFSIVDAAIGIRLNGKKETVGLDRMEHDVEAYPEFTTDGDRQAPAPETDEVVAR